MPPLAGDFSAGCRLTIAGNVKHSTIPDRFDIHLKCSPDSPDIFHLVVDFNRDEGPPSIPEEPCEVQITCDLSSFTVLVNEQVACFRYTRPMEPINYVSVDGNLTIIAIVVTHENAVPPLEEDQSGSTSEGMSSPSSEQELPDEYKISMFERIEIAPDTSVTSASGSEDSLLYSTMIRLNPAFYSQ